MSDKKMQLQSRATELRSQIMRMNSLVSKRMAAAGAVGSTHDGERDIYATLGYKLKPEFEDFFFLYEREGVAGGIVDLIADESWRKHPIIIDGESRTSVEQGQSEFIKAIVELDKRVHLYSMLNHSDRVIGYSKYSVVFLGIPESLEGEDVLKTEVSGADNDIAYITVYDEKTAIIKQKDTNQASPRYMLPKLYTLLVDGEEKQGVTVHWSRCFHVKLDRPSSRIYGRPRLQRIYNYIEDWRKVIGGSSEAFWLNVAGGLIVLLDKDVSIPSDSPSDDGDDEDNYEYLLDQIEAFMHQQQKYLNLEGAKEVKEVGAKPVAALEQKEVLISALSITTRIPQRILEGSERGQLASTQDDLNFADHINTRQENQIEPFILGPFIQQLIDYKILPTPSSGSFEIEFPSLFELSPLQASELLESLASTINTLSGGAPEMLIEAKDLVGLFFPDVALLIENDGGLDDEEQAGEDEDTGEEGEEGEDDELDSEQD